MKKTSSLLDWLGFNENPDLTEHRLLGRVLGFILSFVALVIAIMVVIGIGLLLATFLGFGPYSQDSTGAAIRNLGLVLAAIVGFPFIVWRSIVAQKNAVTAEQAQITDRINKAVQGLGTEKLVKRLVAETSFLKDENGWVRNEDGTPIPETDPLGIPLTKTSQFEETLPNIEVRVGAILSLERIASDSARDFEHIQKLLATYVRENASRQWNDNKLREDLQSAVSVIASRPPPNIDTAKSYGWRTGPDLSNSILDKLMIFGGSFFGATINSTNFRDADLRHSNFQSAWCENGCDFSGAELEGCIFDNAWLVDVRMSQDTSIAELSFRNAYLRRVSFSGDSQGPFDFSDASLADCEFNEIELEWTSFRNANISGTSFELAQLFETDFTGVKNWKQEQFDGAFGVRDGEGKVLLPEGAEYPDHWTDFSTLSEEYDAFSTFDEEYKIWRKYGKEAYKQRMAEIMAGSVDLNESVQFDDSEDLSIN